MVIRPILFVFFLWLTNYAKCQIEFSATFFPKDDKFFLIGETHQVSENKERDLKFIEYLAVNNHLKYIVIEHSYSAAILYNTFLKTGDESIICNDFYFHPNEESRAFWRKLYSMNRTFGYDFIIIGLDFERSYPMVKAINMILNRLEYLDEELEYINLKAEKFLQSIDPENVDIEKYEDIKNSFNQYVNQKETDYQKNIFKEWYTDIQLIYSNQHDQERNRTTNRKMYNNLINILATKKYDLKGYSFLGIFGAAHVSSEKSSLANILNTDKDSPFRNYVNTTISHYLNLNYNKSAYWNQGAEEIRQSIKKSLNKNSEELSNWQLFRVNDLISKKSKFEKHFANILIMKNQHKLLPVRANCIQ